MNMSAQRFALRSQHVVLPRREGPATVVIEGERITAIEPYDADLGETPAEDLGSLWISPGLVDCHVHLNEPGRTQWEGFATATRAAAAGGITTLVDMPLNCIPATTDVAALHAKRQAAAGQVAVDVGFFGGVIPGNAEELGPLMDAGVLGFKAFLIESGVDEFPHVGESDLRTAMPRLAARGVPLLAHCELDLGAPETVGPPSSYQTYLRSRPSAWEDAAIELLIRLSEEAGCPAHVVHLSSAGALDTIDAARARGAQLSVETCPHYLYFAAERIPDGNPCYKCAPPIREEANRHQLWSALKSGLIDFIVSDHSPCSPDLKLLPSGDIMGAWGGIAGLQLSWSATWTAARQQGVACADLLRAMTQRPAEFAGLSRKGRIEVGADADLAVLAPEQQRVVDPHSLQHRHSTTPYAGEQLWGCVQRTYLRGTLVFGGDDDFQTKGQLLEGRV